jgi:hypothetical protein
MRRLSLLALASLPFIVGPAFAQSTGTVTVNGSVADRCLFTTPSAVIALGEMTNAGGVGGAGKLDPSRVNGQSRTLVGWCNGTAATMGVEAQPLLNSDYTGPAISGFDARVDYTATAVANSVSASDSSTVAAPGSVVGIGLFTGNVVVNLSAASTPTSGLLVAGNYGGQVLVTLAPNVSFGGE